MKDSSLLPSGSSLPSQMWAYFSTAPTEYHPTDVLKAVPVGSAVCLLQQGNSAMSGFSDYFP